ncbi:hypothetical protein J7T55_000435 [Diaporthe amygdali]|uniref:uncharacterized protein n=1 Tax=Phomopsis amygdali TaxID=1214568 RepID=UPI0022FEF25B|nr:uncharacterized protein J7T55_000435 [Diaporthe amygdali]KAJ0109509.1 hypothetical protein J7T55_000435 [Diaporthe amygdali]
MASGRFGNRESISNAFLSPISIALPSVLGTRLKLGEHSMSSLCLECEDIPSLSGKISASGGCRFDSWYGQSGAPDRVDYESVFEEVPATFTEAERATWLSQLKDVAVSSDAFFPFVNNIYRAARSGAKYIAAPGGSQNDSAVYETSKKLGIVFVEQNIRLFHH